MNIDERINELLDELNQLYTCKFIGNLTWDNISIGKNPIRGKMYLTAKVAIPHIHITPLSRSEYYKQRIIKVSLGLMEKVNLDDETFRLRVIQRIQRFAKEKFGC